MDNIWFRICTLVTMLRNLLIPTTTPAPATPLFSFIISGQPASINNTSKKKAAYAARVVAAFKARYPYALPSKTGLYCRVYHFYRVEAKIDADNISKPTLDALNLHAYDDDFQIKIRTAGSQNVGTTGPHMIDLGRMDPAIAVVFSQYVGTQDHTLYVEIGDLNHVEFEVGVGG